MLQVTVYDLQGVRVPLHAKAKASIVHTDKTLVGVWDRAGFSAVALAYIPEGAAEEDIEAAKEWLLNFTYLCLEEG